MSEKISALKAQAKNLQAALNSAGTTATLSFAQELVAQQYGATDWNTLLALASRTASEASTKAVELVPRLSQVPAIPDEILVENGPYTKAFDITDFDEDGMALVDVPAEEGEDDDYCVIFGIGDGENVELTLRELRAAKGKMLGGTACWELEDGRYISFRCGTPWAPPAVEAPASKSEDLLLHVPALMARSSRGASVTPVKQGLAVLPANLSMDRFQELLAQRVGALSDANEALVSSTCAQLGVQWLNQDALERAGVKLLSSGSSPKEPTVIPETYIPAQHLRWALNPVQKGGRWTVSLTVPVSSEKVEGPTADYLSAVREVSLRATGTESGLLNVVFYPADSRTLPPLSAAGLQWVRLEGTLAF